jgi:hypothetical protein
MISVTSADMGAPGLTETPGSLMAVLRFALPQLGWTEEFVDEPNHVCSWRNDIADGATGHYLEILDGAVAHGGEDNKARFRGYSEMSGVSQGAGQFGNAWVAREYNAAQYNTAGNPIDWRIIGDGKSFWLMFNPEGHFGDAQMKQPCFWYFGDGARFGPQDTTFFMVSGTSSGSIGYTTEQSVFHDLGSVQLLKASESAVDQTVGVDIRPVNTAAEGDTSWLRSGCVGDVFPAEIGGGLTNAPITLREANRYRGMLRGVFGILVNVTSETSRGFVPTGSLMENVETFKGTRSVEIIWLTARPRISVSTPTLILAFDTDWSDW